MSFLSYLSLNSRQHPQTPPVHHPESKVIAGLLAEIGLIRTLIASLNDDVAQSVVSRCGEYLRCALEKELGYDRMNDLFEAVGLFSASHFAYEWSEKRNMKIDKLDYGRQLTSRERLTDRAQRLDSIAKLIVEFGFSGIRNDQEKACAYLFRLRPSTNLNQARNDE